MKKTIAIATLIMAASSVFADDNRRDENLGALDAYWAQRGYYREKGDTVYHSGYNADTQAVVDAIERQTRAIQESIEQRRHSE